MTRTPPAPPSSVQARAQRPRPIRALRAPRSRAHTRPRRDRGRRQSRVSHNGPRLGAREPRRPGRARRLARMRTPRLRRRRRRRSNELARDRDARGTCSRWDRCGRGYGPRTHVGASRPRHSQPGRPAPRPRRTKRAFPQPQDRVPDPISAAQEGRKHRQRELRQSTVRATGSCLPPFSRVGAGPRSGGLRSAARAASGGVYRGTGT